MIKTHFAFAVQNIMKRYLVNFCTFLQIYDNNKKVF